ncbi:hypothetical protein HMPREF1991_02315 [Hoylesella loescheii DSM 19665 = JCM 12249 = ATCC 15930]|uniref:Uncharacterized protein n=1 Tax=Hoylesella loescheii DSM 19665 = JCM 12249 = ATCC 15930 TaxID=1122985 RepID=A0A069QFE4_HOYLO|nr:hypothetical protein HMPREF1991_02315 [Hoylesella loescheii DSM 19665 = JCM 12249 = ATCC 15930]
MAECTVNRPLIQSIVYIYFDILCKGSAKTGNGKMLREKKVERVKR